MTSAAVPEEEPRRFRLRPLPAYEPDEVGAPPPRWSSLRPVRGPQLTLAPPLAPPGRPPVSEVALARVVRQVLEVLDGRRPVGQLRALLLDVAFEALLTRLRTVSPGGRHVLRRLRVCYPAPVAVEVSVVMDVHPPHGRPRVRAAAARFERDDDGWLCTVLRFL
jgi:hypothetical protein